MDINTLITIKELLEDKETILLELLDNARKRQYEAEDAEDSEAAAMHKAYALSINKQHSRVRDALQDFTSHEWR